MNVNPDVNFEELARSTDDFNGAQLKAVCVEAGMLALRRDATEVIFFPYLILSFYVTILVLFQLSWMYIVFVSNCLFNLISGYS